MTRKILIADEEVVVRSLVKTTLGINPHYTMLTAADGRETLAIARRERPEIVLLDVSMPGPNGYDVCRALKRDPRTAHAVVLLFTSVDSDAAREEAREAGADGYFTKPFSPTALLTRIYDALGLSV